ncbi:WD40 repeat domain-containing protein [Kitasatospora sp. NBC_01560]|uniref:WD40 repeat domain-containing protein n=1 Tax=Kitasatospora sp. NBC_01560 TaxID=2975965 RepID=UPI0038675332
MGRIVTTADREIADLLPASDTAVRAKVGSISCAVHAKGKTALDVAVEIAAAASAALPDDIEFLPELLREALQGRSLAQSNDLPPDFTVVIDALDEAANPQQARLIIRRIITPLVETCADLNIRVIVGSRRRDDSGDLLASFGRALSTIDLDQPDFFEPEDLRSYTLATLQMLGDERQDNPYADHEIAEPVAHRIASMADRNFLVAGLVARAHGLHDKEAVNPEEIAFIPTVDGALHDYLERIQPVHGCSAEYVLTALAFAEAPGFSLALWRIAVTALGGPPIPETSLAAFARSSAANFLVEAGGSEHQEFIYRLFHQALNDTLISARGELHTRRDDERALTHAMIAEGERRGWGEVDPYLKRSLPAHAEAGESLDDLISNELYLLHADLRRLLPVTDRATSELARSRTKYIRRTPQAFNADPARRVALFSVTETQQRLGRIYSELPLPAPYRARWSTAVPGLEEAVMEGHTRWSYVLRALNVGGRELLASAGGDRTVRIWDPVLGEVVHVMEGHTDEIRAIVAVRLGSIDAIASTGRDGVIRFWDPLTGEVLHSIGGDLGGYSALCCFTRDGQTFLAAATSAGATIRLLDPITGDQVGSLDGHDDWITDLCEINVDGIPLLASCSEDGTVRLWEPDTNTIRWTITHQDPWDWEWTRALCAIQVRDRVLLAGGGYDSKIRLWDPRNGNDAGILEGHGGPVLTLCSATLDGVPVLASAGEDETVRLWDPAAGRQLALWRGHTDSVYSVCAILIGTQLRLASSGDDRSIRIWDPATGEQNVIAENDREGLFDAACAIRVNSELLMATARIGDDEVAIRNPATWKRVRTLATGAINAMCPVPFEGIAHLAVAGSDIEIWNPSGSLVRVLKRPRARYTSITSICSIKLDGNPILVGSLGDSLHFWDISQETTIHGFDIGRTGAREICPIPVHGRLAIAGITFDGRVGVWEPGSGELAASLSIGRGSITTQCAVRVDGEVLLATGNEFGAIQLWNATTEQPVASLEGHSGRVSQIWVAILDGRRVLVSSGDDRSIRVWDPVNHRPLTDIPVQHTIVWAAQAGPDITLSLETGMLALRLDLPSVGLD